MLSYITKKLEEEYHHLSLWYFVSFFYGIIFYFKSIDQLMDYDLFDRIFPLGITFSVVFSIILVFLRKAERLFATFIVSLLLFFVIGMSVASFKLNYAQSNPLEKAGVFDIEARVSGMKPTISGVQVILEDVKEKTSLRGAAWERGNLMRQEKFLSKIKIHIKGKDASALEIGDMIKTRVNLFPISSSILPGGYDFGIYMYLNGIEASGYALGNVEIISDHVNSKTTIVNFEKINNIRNIIYHKLIDVLGKYEGNFVAAILIGETKAIDHKMAQNMRNSGIAHILSVSGLHLTLVAMIFFVVSRFLLNCSNYLSYRINVKVVAGVISILGSFGYLLLSGSNIAATRAFIMTLIVILSIIFERSPYPLRSVMIAGMLILFIYPEYIMHPSFQLSFSAVLCLISGYEIYLKNQQLFGSCKGLLGSVKLYVFSNIYSSFLASIVTAPFVIYHFYKFASYSILMNLLAVPLMSFFMMPLAIIALALMPFGVSDLPLKILGFFVKIVTDSAAQIVKLPYAVINTGYITEFSMFVFTLGFFWVCLWQKAWRYFGIVIMLISIVMMYFAPKPDFIFDYRTSVISIKNQDTLNIYSKRKISDFTKEYLYDWYGISKGKSIVYEKGFVDNVFEIQRTDRAIKVSLNYSRCTSADVQLILKEDLNCNNGKLIVSNKDLELSGVVLVFCDKDECHVKLGNRPIWKEVEG